MLPAQAVVLWRALKINTILRVSMVMICVCCVLSSYAQTPATDTTQKSADTSKVKSDTTARRKADTSTVKTDTAKAVVNAPVVKSDTAKAQPETSRADTSKTADAPVTAADAVKAQTDTPVSAGDSATISAGAPALQADSSRASADSSQLMQGLQAASDSLGTQAGADSLQNGKRRKRRLSSEPLNENEIGKLEDCEIPFTMAYNIKHMSYKELDSLRIEFQKIILEEEEEKIITIKMRFRDDHIIGYMTQAPIHHSNKYVVINMPINVKIEWCCVPDSTHPSQHCAISHAEMVNIDTTEHCKKWAQLDDGTDMLEQLAANKKKIDLSKYKKKRKFNPLAIFNVFKKKKKKDMIAIPMDKSLEEILKSGDKSANKSRSSP